MTSIYNQIISIENLYIAFGQASRGKKYRDYVLEYWGKLNVNLYDLHWSLVNMTYAPGEYKTRIVKDSKRRSIKVAPYEDRVVHHALCNYIEPIFDKGFIYHNFACRVGRGNRKAVKIFQKFLLNPDNKYCLQMDISKYFQSIDHEILYKIICRKIKDPKALWLIKTIIDSSSDQIPIPNRQYQLFPTTGIPIGNLTSQLFANLYLNELDQYIKHKLKMRYYMRYMDDFVILGESKFALAKMRKKIHNFLLKKLKLIVHPKKQNIYAVRKGVVFLGYKIYPKCIEPKAKTVKRFLYRLAREKNATKKKQMQDSFENYLEI